MQLKAFWRSLIAAAAIAIFFGGAAQTQAQTSNAPQASAGKPLALGKYVKKRPRHHARKAATRHSRHSSKKTAKKSSSSQRSTKAKSADNRSKKNNEKEQAKTASVRKAAEELSAVADARAEMKTDDLSNSSPAKTATSESANANAPAAADTLTDLDKAAAAASILDSPIATPTAAVPVRMVAAVPAPEPAVPPVSSQTVSSRDDVGDTWDRTSLIGKIFVAFGGLLTLASAARMFMA
jgi:hypothetical protein